jgi:hypothetical protein
VSGSLHAWIETNPLAPAEWRLVADRLLSVSDDIKVFSAAHHTYSQATSEVSRMTQTEENAAFDLVQRRIADLRQALECAPLPRNTAQMLQISGAELPDAALTFGWYEYDYMVPGAYSMSLHAILELADKLLQAHRAALALRAVRRHRERPLPAAFVHWLDYFARQSGIEIDVAQMSEITNAVLALDRKDLMFVDDIRAILKTTHPKLSTAKRRR